ncbi:YajG family lipoprotein [[Haemophilus] ducreyi]|uniref:YajG family lipoprotein n=1 Tax=Haemophilus ducreyi TaxID=730 RepID=UPI0006550B9F|nr:YajG family lipoprotein [[Haemophilus] ducreyi]AKO45875.1 hypothetical protein RZ66_06640 [[Haemophilus] ducreyi]AKO47234.1 hypothetical protein RZ67_06415 [[Haemophilus] ducreyi]AKO48598.1 hypothetical protein RZ68_06495 [[Haemophilus] ducreyi]AKO49968.1 hypothetical protein RZ69_06440 [[Haemophilus] ducreyi]ANF62321.1 hypothetical protein A6037_06190 [[Haemophilus] ducreyi]
MKLSKKAFILLALLSSAILIGCQSQSNILTFTTPSPTTTFNTNNQNVMVNISAQDSRPSHQVASYIRKGNIHHLTANQDVALIVKQALMQDLNAKGFQLVQCAGNANVVVNIQKFFANVEQGNLRYKINTEVSIEIVVNGLKGKFNKHFNASRSHQGASITMNHNDIRDILNQTYQDVIQTIYNDNEISNAIHQFK